MRGAKAVFIDRDGTLIVERNYLHDPDLVAFERGAVPALRRLRADGFKIVMITNQSGIGRGYFTESDANAVHDRIDAMLAAEGLAVDGWFMCPHAPDQECDCRKPRPGLGLQAADALGLDLASSFMLGDKASDVAFAAAIGARGALVRTGHGDADVAWAERNGHPVFDDIEAAAAWICAGAAADGGEQQERRAAEQAWTRLRRWLVEASLPVWAADGVDRRDGGYFEKLGDDRQPVRDPRRTRVVGRQIFSFARSGARGWLADWREPVVIGLDYFFAHSLNPDGGVFSATQPDGAVVRPAFDLYDHAFALFGLAEASRTLPEQRDRCAAAARDILSAMVRGWKHPRIGFEEASPRRLPLLSNPHMHLLEAFLEWRSLDPAHEAWNAMAEEVLQLAFTHLIDPERGVVHEYFDGDWRPLPGLPGQTWEPGHQFEWAWLILRARPQDDRAWRAARRLVGNAENHGVRSADGVAIAEVHDDHSLLNGTARIWGQCERIKAHVALLERLSDAGDRTASFAAITRSCEALMRFFEHPVPGLWRDKMNEDGSLDPAASPASSLYHIVMACSELEDFLTNLARA
jgi:D,D-heptose 1,7-bisphosphate phosphatase